jgi:fatty acid desaturase
MKQPSTWRRGGRAISAQGYRFERIHVQRNLEATVRGFIRSLDANRWWFERHEGPTLLVAFVIYASWAMLLFCHHILPAWMLAVAGGYVIQWHSSLQHEAIHAMRGVPKWLRVALVYPPLGVWLPFELYRRSHLQHHRNSHLTSPDEDTESFYHDERDWKSYDRLRRAVLIVNQTFLGRLFVGPFLYVGQLYWDEGRKAVFGDTDNLGIWLWHVVASGLVLLAVTLIFDMQLWLYFAAFSYPGLVFGMVRSFTEHRWSEHAGERTAIVESNWIFGLLFSLEQPPRRAPQLSDRIMV